MGYPFIAVALNEGSHGLSSVHHGSGLVQVYRPNRGGQFRLLSCLGRTSAMGKMP